MLKITRSIIAILWLSPLCLAAQSAGDSKPCMPCEQLKSLQLPDVTILSAEQKVNDTIKGQASWIPVVVVKVPYCKVMGRISKEINFELLLPVTWNRRFLMSGGGGFVGYIQNGLRNYVNEGYATAGTDTGHSGNEITAEWGLDNMERQLNFGRLAIHRTAVVSKSIMRTFYCGGPDYSYFHGCSRGGGQAMIEAQFYPDDFNGIVAGAPAYAWPAIGAKFTKVNQANYPNPKELKPVLSNDNLKFVQQSVMKQCDALDGVKDNILNDPRECKFDPATLPVCQDGKSGSGCITKEQLAVLKAVYDPLVINKQEVYPGFPVGLEAEQGSWDVWIAGTSTYPDQNGMPSLHYFFGTNMFKYLVFNDASWDYSKYDFSNFFKDTQYASAYLDATQTDYGEFKKLNGKMIMYHGWNDPALSAYATIEHYQAALERDKDLPSNIRLFMLPGVLHCFGGQGPDQVDWVKLIRDWVEHGQAPECILTSKMVNGKTTMTRPAFPYPKVSKYDGKGDPNSEKSFSAK